jgi:hypothetical protein
LPVYLVVADHLPAFLYPATVILVARSVLVKKKMRGATGPDYLEGLRQRLLSGKKQQNNGYIILSGVFLHDSN